MNKEYTIKIDKLPEGYKPTEFREPKSGELFIGYDGAILEMCKKQEGFSGPRLIMQKDL